MTNEIVVTSEQDSFLNTFNEEDKNYLLKAIDPFFKKINALKVMGTHDPITFSTVTGSITNRCNLKCKHCSMSALAREDK